MADEKLVPFNYKWARDASERVVATFVEAFLGALVLTSVADVNVDNVEKAAFAGLVAAFSAVKVVVARWTGKYDTASTID